MDKLIRSQHDVGIVENRMRRGIKIKHEKRMSLAE